MPTYSIGGGGEKNRPPAALKLPDELEFRPDLVYTEQVKIGSVPQELVGGNQMNKQMVGVQDLMAVLNIQYSAALALIERGAVPGAIKIGRAYRIPASVIENAAAGRGLVVSALS